MSDFDLNNFDLTDFEEVWEVIGPNSEHLFEFFRKKNYSVLEIKTCLKKICDCILDINPGQHPFDEHNNLDTAHYDRAIVHLRISDLDDKRFGRVFRLLSALHLSTGKTDSMTGQIAVQESTESNYLKACESVFFQFTP